MRKSVQIKVFNEENLQMPVWSKEFFFMLLLFIIFIPSSFDQSINSVSLYIIIPVLFIYSLYKSFSLFRKFRMFRLFTILFCIMFLSGIVAINKDMYWAEMKQMAGVIMFTFILIHFSWRDSRFIYYFYVLYIIKFLYIFFYAYQNGLFQVDLSSERFELQELNANVFGYFGFFAIISSFMLMTFTLKRQKRFYYILFFIIFCLVIVAGVLAASRATLIISAISFVLLLLVRYFYPLSIRSVFPLCFIILSIVISVTYLNSTLQNSLIKSRFDAKEDSRYDLLSKAIEVGKENPILGVGSGNFVLYNPDRQFSHNSFAELWATSGGISLIVFILILGDILRAIKAYNKLSKNKKIMLYFVVVWLTYCVYNLFYVFYINFFMLDFLFLIRVHLEYLKRAKLKLIKSRRAAMVPRAL